MADKTAISWCDHTFNPWIGCQNFGPQGVRYVTTKANWRKPIAWNKAAEREGRARTVFCGSLCDVFEDRSELTEHRLRLFDLIDDTPDLIWLLLTKRPATARSFCDSELYNEPFLRSNLWVGATIESNDMIDARLLDLLNVPAIGHFISCEPLLGFVTLPDWSLDIASTNSDIRFTFKVVNSVDWVIAGGESGPHARPSHPDWFRALRDQCAEAEIPYHFKQWGEWDANGDRAGKKTSGHLLDGREHLEFPNEFTRETTQ